MFSSGAIRIVIVTGTANILCGARSMHLSGVRPSVCLSVDMSVPARAHSSKPAAAGLLLWAGRQEISIDCCAAHGMRRANSGSATFTADVRSWTQTCFHEWAKCGSESKNDGVRLQKKIGWRSQSRKLVVMSTDASFHYAGDGKVRYLSTATIRWTSCYGSGSQRPHRSNCKDRFIHYICQVVPICTPI